MRQHAEAAPFVAGGATGLLFRLLPVAIDARAVLSPRRAGEEEEQDYLTVNGAPRRSHCSRAYCAPITLASSGPPFTWAMRPSRKKKVIG
jgi:hypothetical protein